MKLTGILLDVSGSMQSNIGSGIDEEGEPWARSIFKVIDDLIENDDLSENQVFAFGVGASCNQEIFDVIGTVKKMENHKMPYYTKNVPATIDHIEDALEILEMNGARNIRNWAKVDVIQEVLSDFMAALILMKLKSDQLFLEKFVKEFLPRACRDTIAKPSPGRQINAQIFGVVLGVAAIPFSGPLGILGAAIAPLLTVNGAPMIEDLTSSQASRQLPATIEDIYEVVQKAKCYFLEEVGSHSIFSVKDASHIIRGCIDENELSTERSRELLENVEPFIYGRTPLYEALSNAALLFQRNTAKNKLLFVLSDGEPTDGGNEDTAMLNQAVLKLRDSGVKVVSCFITRSTDIQPKRLYDKLSANWETGGKFLFSLSSELPTELLPRAILIKRDWTIDIDNNETKLFVQVNHPDNLKEICDIARNVVCLPDALAEILASVNLDIYINQTKGGFKAKKQDESTCYANASAAVLHLAMKRILGREGGYPDFYALREEMIQGHGKSGAYIIKVLQEICPKYRLHYQEVGIKKAKEAIVAKRPVVVTFHLTNEEWSAFSNFYKNNPTGVLTANEMNVRRRSPSAATTGHAVVLSSYNSKCLMLMNSWGSDWADNGFFRVKDAEVLQLKFIDVFWILDDLTEGEKAYYKNHGSEVARKLMSSLKGLQKAEYQCPRCNINSLATDFTGTLSEAECPKCSQKFPACDNEGNSLALNMYLTSLSR